MRLLAGAALVCSIACGGSVVSLPGEPLDPNAYRAQIVAIDAVVFEDGPITDAVRATLETSLLDLGKAAAKAASSPNATTLQVNVRTLASIAKGTNAGASLLNSPLRQQWLSVRGTTFDDAAWFRHSSADPIEPAVPGPPPPSALRPPTVDERKGLDLTLISLATVLDNATRDLPNAYDSEPHKQFVADAERELALDVERLGPPPPAWGIDVFYKNAYGHAAEALRQMKALTGLGVGAPRSSREYLIGRVEVNLAKAREAAAQVKY